MPITSNNFDFLNTLKQNNNRDWFNENKQWYLKNHEETIAFADEVLSLMNQHDNIETPNGKKSLFRIYKDTRFSKDKTPYKTHWGGYLRRATNALRGGYYFHIEPGNSFVGGGFWGPNADDLKRIREEIAIDSTDLREILADKNFAATFKELKGEQLKTAPKGFPKDHPDIDLLRYKQFIVSKSFTDKEVLSNDFYETVNTTFKQLRPFFDYMSEVLTTDANGVSII